MNQVKNDRKRSEEHKRKSIIYWLSKRNVKL